jgi:hypothetical protein
MQTHILTITHSGLLADLGAMDAAHAERTVRGARRLLAASAYYTRGHVPDRLSSRTREFQIVEFAPEQGSVKRDLLIAIAWSALYDVVRVPFPAVLLAAVALSTLALMNTKREWWVELGKRIKERMQGEPPEDMEAMFPPPAYHEPYSQDLQARVFEKASGSDLRAGYTSPVHQVVAKTTEAFEDLMHVVEHRGAARMQASLDGELLVNLAPGGGAQASTSSSLDRQLAAAADQLRALRRSRTELRG